MLRDIIIAPFVPTTSQFLDLLLVHNVPHEVFDYDKLAEKYNENEITSVLRIIDDKLYCNPARTVHVQFPVRINLAGGWTDTPPYTLAEGGAVLNVAIKINGNNPVNVHAAFTDKPVFRFVMVEQDKTITAEFSTLEDLFTYDDPSTHFALHKAVVCFMFFPKLCVLKNQRQIVYKQDLKKYFFDTLRSDTPIGIEIVTRVTDVPHGSGLGTSSILILACVKAIRLLFDNDDTREAISFSQQDNDNILTLGSERERMEMYKEFDAVLAIEQMLTTGGYAYTLIVFTFSGWQDQIGGALSGVKLIETQPLVELSHNQYSIKLIEAKQDLRDRFLVVYTGKQRMAKRVLTNVVENYIVRVENTLAALSSLKAVTGNMFNCFERLNSEGSSEQLFQKIGVLLSEVKRLNVCLSPETENQMQHVFDALAPYAHGSCMIGAGAGGFVVAILRGDQVGKREQVVEELRKVDNKLLLCNVDIC
jgi:fucokinase